MKKRSLNILKKISALTVGIVTVLSLTAPAYARTYNDIDNIMRGIKINIPQKLIIASPAKDITTTASTYYISGTSNPNYNLTCNGYDVSAVGKQGSFATFVDLDFGINTFTFAQGDGSTATVKITRSQGGGATKTNTVTKMQPEYASAFVSGDTVTLKCVAPYGASIQATVMGNTYELSPVSSAQNGTPTTYKRDITFPSVSSVQNIGSIKYTMTYNGNTKTYLSDGKVTAYPQGATIYVEVIDPTTPLLNDPDNIDDVMCAVRLGAVDYVVDQNAYRYKLACGGWINKVSVEPIQNIKTTNHVNEINFYKTLNGETITFTGNSRPIVDSYQTGDTLELKMYHTSGFSSLPSNINTSEAISSYSIENYNDYTLLKLKLKKEISGHVVNYDGNTISLYIKYKAKANPNSSQPLKNITIAIDPGHGGIDLGATGVTHTSGDSECHITANAAIALKRRLESLGANVVVANINPDPKAKTTYYKRMQPAFINNADLFISLHCNSAVGDARKPNGVEVYYYYSRHRAAAESVLNNVVAHTGRTKRKAQQAVYRVTFNSLAPAMLLEMGFISNPKEYDELNSRWGIFNTVNGIADGIIEYFS